MIVYSFRDLFQIKVAGPYFFSLCIYLKGIFFFFYLVLVEPLIVRLRTGHVSVRNSIAVRRVASDGDRVGGDNNGGVSIVVGAGATMVDEDIANLDVAGRSLLVPAGASPPVSGLEAVTKVLGTNLLLPTRIPSAGSTARKLGVTTSKKALGDKVGAIPTVPAITASLATPVRIGRAGGVGAALVVGSAPVLLGVVHSSVPIVGEGSREEKSNDTNRFEHD